LKYGIATMEEEILLHSKVGGKRVEGGSHCRNIKQQTGGVKKEQVKGCGSVNRPTPGSQRPAEPVAQPVEKVQRKLGFFLCMSYN
jgi:hypothetical protein